MRRLIVTALVLLSLATALAPTGAALGCMSGTAQQRYNCLRERLFSGSVVCVHVGGAHGDEPVGHGPWEEQGRWDGYYVYVDGGPGPDDDLGVFVAYEKDCLS